MVNWKRYALGASFSTGIASAASSDASASVTASTASYSSVSACNPLSTSGCSADKALATAIAEDFSSESSYFFRTSSSGEIEYGSDGMAMTINKRFDNPSLRSDFYIMYGKLEVVLKAANGTGIVSSFYLQSDDLDEIDLEWLGGDTTQFQSNYFSKGNTTTYNRGSYHSVNAPQNEFHNYTLDWAMDETVWYLDGTAVRTLANTSDEGYPQSPMYVMMGCWAGGDPSNEPGTIEWAGGETDYSDVPFTMYIKKAIITDYSTGSQYTYNGDSGSWESIEAKDGEVYGRYDQAQEDFAALVDGATLSGSSSTTSSSSSKSSSASSTTSSSSTSSKSSSSSSTTSSLSSSTSSSSSSSSHTPTSTSTSTSSSSRPSSSSSSSSGSSTNSSTSTSPSSSSTSSAPSSSEPAGSETVSSSVSAATTLADASVETSATAEVSSATPSHSSTISTVATSSASSSVSIATATNGASALSGTLSALLGLVALVV